MCVKRPLSKRQKMGFKTNYRLMQVKSTFVLQNAPRGLLQNAPRGHSAILSIFIKLSIVIIIKIFVLSIFEWMFNTRVTVIWNAFDNICCRHSLDIRVLTE